MRQQTPDKRQAILQAAMELIAENGFHGAPTAMIAARAGVGTGSIYRYFADKDVLIQEVFTAIEDRLHQSLMHNYPAGQAIRQRLDHYYHGLVRFFLENPGEFKFLGQFYDSPYGVALRRDKLFANNRCESGNESLKCLFEQGIAAGVIKDLPVVVLFAIFIGSLISVTRDHILGFIILDRHLIQQTADACWDAIKKQE